MHLIRRSAFRAISSPAPSFLSKSRSITTSSPFIARVKPQATISPIFRRLASNDAGSEGGKSEAEAAPSSADSEDQSSIASAISSASESASSYASDAAESLTHNATAAKDRFIDGASSAASAAGLPFAPRERRTEGGYGNKYEDGGRSGPPQGRYGGERQRDFASAESPPIRPSKSVYVGNLLFEVNEDDLTREFSEFGKIEDVKIAKDARNLSKGFGYVTFDSVDAATAAIQAKHQNVMEGRRIVVNYQIASNRPAGVNPPSHTLFIGNLAFEMSDADLNKLFQDVKNVLDVRVAIDRRTGQPRGFAHADFVDTESATKGLQYLQGKEFYGRTLRVDYAGTVSRDRSRTGGV